MKLSNGHVYIFKWQDSSITFKVLNLDENSYHIKTLKATGAYNNRNFESCHIESGLGTESILDKEFELNLKFKSQLQRLLK